MRDIGREEKWGEVSGEKRRNGEVGVAEEREGVKEREGER